MAVLVTLCAASPVTVVGNRKIGGWNGRQRTKLSAYVGRTTSLPSPLTPRILGIDDGGNIMLKFHRLSETSRLAYGLVNLGLFKLARIGSSVLRFPAAFFGKSSVVQKIDLDSQEKSQILVWEHNDTQGLPQPRTHLACLAYHRQRVNLLILILPKASEVEDLLNYYRFLVKGYCIPASNQSSYM